jgi:peptide/nickel transport system substrate-binding protein
MPGRYVIVVANQSTAGVQKGEYHYAHRIKADQYERLIMLPNVEPRIWKRGAWLAAAMNHKQGVMTSKKVRRAVHAALDMEPIMSAAIGHPLFYRMDPSLFTQEQWPWHSTAGGNAYNQRDKDKARRLLREAGYAGQPVRWMTTKDYDDHYQSALVASQQLAEIGLKVDLQVYDWTTFIQRLASAKPELWNIYSVGWGGYFDPVLNPVLSCRAAGWWCLEEKDRLMAEIDRESDLTRRKVILEKVQKLFYEDVGQIKLGDFFTLDAVRKELRGHFRSQYVFAFYNAWLEPTKK